MHSKNDLLKGQHGAYVINIDEYNSMGTHWIALNVNGNNGSSSYDEVYFDSFAVEHIPKEINQVIRNKDITTNINRIRAYYSIMCGCFCIGFIDRMLKDKSQLDYKNLFSPNEYEKNDKIMLKYLQ